MVGTGIGYRIDDRFRADAVVRYCGGHKLSTQDPCNSASGLAWQLMLDLSYPISNRQLSLDLSYRHFDDGKIKTDAGISTVQVPSGGLAFTYNSGGVTGHFRANELALSFRYFS